jgi:hypothetical protein
VPSAALRFAARSATSMSRLERPASLKTGSSDRRPPRGRAPTAPAIRRSCEGRTPRRRVPRRFAAQPVAHPAADHERAAAGGADGLGQARGRSSAGIFAGSHRSLNRVVLQRRRSKTGATTVDLRSGIALLRDLVAIDSVNPSLVPGAAGELAVARAWPTRCARRLTVEISRPRRGGPT